jgi:hypothetical protein
MLILLYTMEILYITNKELQIKFDESNYKKQYIELTDLSDNIYYLNKFYKVEDSHKKVDIILNKLDEKKRVSIKDTLKLLDIFKNLSVKNRLELGLEETFSTNDAFYILNKFFI